MATPTICQSPAIVNLSFVPGDTLALDINLKDSDLLPINIHGYTIEAYITVEATVYDFTVTIIDELLGQTHIEMNAETTALITNNSEWVYKITNGSTQTFTYLMGKVNLQQL